VSLVPTGFGGRHTYGVPNAADATQRLARFEPGSAIAFDWELAGAASSVTITVRSALAATSGAAQTDLSIEQHFSRRPTMSRPEELVEDWWRLALGNLDAHLRGGDGVLRPDFTDPAPAVRLSVLIDAPRERVFAALTEPELLNQWIASAAVVNLQPGGAYRYGWSYPVGGRQVAGGPTKILAVVPNEQLVTDWPDWRGDPGQPPTTVTWLLAAEGSKTRVTLVHSGFSRVADLSDYPHGWSGFLGKLAAIARRPR
jgi:uncharacterized protein YndB with AHSA1/START domain